MQTDRQARECRDLAREMGWPEADEFIDNDVSAYRNKPRPAYERLLEAIRVGRNDGVLVWHPDRLHRSPRELERYIDIAGDIPTISVRAGAFELGTTLGRLHARTAGAVARYEVEQSASRTRAGKADAAARGAWAGGPPIYGYQLVPAHERPPGTSALRIIPAQQAVVEEAAQRLLAGDSLRAIAKSLNERGETTGRGKPWTGSALRKVLLRPSTAGLRAMHGQVVGAGEWDPLIPEDLWRGVCALLSDTTRRTTIAYSRVYLGSGLYVCGVCGGTLTGNKTAGGSGDSRRAAYRCRVADREGAVHVVRDAAYLDDFVQRLAMKRLAMADVRDKLVVPPEDTLPLQSEAASLRARLQQAAVDQANDRISRSQLLAATQALRGRLQDVEARIAQQSRGTALGALLDDSGMLKDWERLDLDRRRLLLAALFTVTVLPRARRGRLPGGGYFDPDGQRITWHV